MKKPTTFQLNENQEAKLTEWLEFVRRKGVEMHGEDPLHPGYPRLGAVGGGITYSFTPTGIGLAVTVKDFLTGEVISLTDWEEW